jgi:hypothetical protein
MAVTTLDKLLSLAGEFVTAQKGVWDHDAWEALLEKAAALGMVVSDDSKRSLGNILESAKFFYFCGDESEKPKRAAAKPRAKAKAKAKV